MSDFSEQQRSSEFVPVKVNRVFDSCSDRDCFNDIEVFIEGGGLPEDINVVKSKCAEVSSVCINVEPINFNRGYYSVDITFTFKLELLGYKDTPCAGQSIPLKGKAYVSKSVILFGNEINTKTFFSDNTDTQGTNNECCQIVNLPTASVQVVSPIVLETKIGCARRSHCGRPEHKDELPAELGQQPTLQQSSGTRDVFVTIGLFSITELSRPVTLYVQAFPYMVAQKECCCDSDTPCQIFDRIDFPIDEFSPSGVITDDSDSSGTCNGCNS